MGTIPEELRGAVAAQLAALVGGELPELLAWVREYGERGATLVPQPEAIWTHAWADSSRVAGGGWHLVLPLWTTEESPSDLSAEVEVTAEGTARITSVHVL